MAVERVYGGTGLIDVLDRILDKGLVIDAWVRVSLVGIELLTVEARVVVASVDTYLRYAQAIGLTPLSARPPQEQGRGAPGSGQNGNGQQGGGGLLGGLTEQLQGGQQGGQQGGGGGLLGGLTNQLQGGQDGGQNGGGPLQGLSGQLQGVLDQLQGSQSEGGGNALPEGVTDQLRTIVEQLQGAKGGQGQGG